MATPQTEAIKRPKRKYDAAFRAEALALLKANGDNVYATAEQLNMPRLTLREWAKNGRGVTPEVLAIQQTKETDMVGVYSQIETAYGRHALDPLTIAATSGIDAVKASAIATDKKQLLLGNPTSIHGSVMSEDERRLRVAELLAKIDARSRAVDQSPLQVSETSTGMTPATTNADRNP